ncbi:hypothetical protein [Planctomycetes bacterium K23_9]|uniref:Uncharacterized protein n=1 Tax=Stieleria marina TaxID=1930275 RepID=A0A517P383_9BACT|nr:hypothetical protein K239x_58540 [Planctomycetes bacterium K23_9]
MPEIPISSDQPADVPTFRCIVYVWKTDSGTAARVMNLDGIECTAASERDALSKIVPAFKKRLGELVQSGEEIQWTKPPPLADGQQKRFIPVHL